jgi:hypothetical protein
MTSDSTEIDKIGAELSNLAKAYAEKAASLAHDPYFREAVVKVSTSAFIWALYHAFDDELVRSALNEELKVQSLVLDRTVNHGDKATQ